MALNYDKVGSGDSVLLPDDDKSTSSNGTETESKLPTRLRKKTATPNCNRASLFVSNILNRKLDFSTEKKLKQLIQFTPSITTFYPVSFVPPSLNTVADYQNYIYECLEAVALLQKTDFLPAIDALAFKLEGSRKVVMLDMDETLLHCKFDAQSEGDVTLTVRSDEDDFPVVVTFRPLLMEFLKSISKEFDVYVFTASEQKYADAILDYLDPLKKLIKGRFYREKCVRVNDEFTIKDLRIFGIALTDIIIVENNLFSFANQLSNGVLVSSFYSDKSDVELKSLSNYLLNYVLPAEDVRAVNEKVFGFEKICASLMSSVMPI